MGLNRDKPPLVSSISSIGSSSRDKRRYVSILNCPWIKTDCIKGKQIGDRGDIVRQKDTGYVQTLSTLLPSNADLFILAGTKKPRTAYSRHGKCRIGLCLVYSVQWKKTKSSFVYIELYIPSVFACSFFSNCNLSLLKIINTTNMYLWKQSVIYSI